MSATTTWRDYPYMDDEIRLGFDHVPGLEEVAVPGFEQLVAEVDALRKISTFKEHLFERALAGADVRSLVDVLGQFLGRPVTAVGSGLGLGEGSTDLSTDSGREIVVPLGAVPIVVDRHVLGHLVMNPTPEDPDSTDRQVVTAAARVIGLMLQRSRAGPNDHRVARQKVLVDLLRGDVGAERAVFAWGSSVGYDLARPGSLIVVEASHIDTHDDPTGETFVAPVFEALVGQLCLVAPWHGRVVVLIADHSESRSKRRCDGGECQLEPSETIYEAVKRLALSPSPVVAVAPGYGHPSDVPRLFAEAVDAIRVARRLGPIDGVVRADDRELRAYQILAGERNENRVRSFVADVLGKLATYDARHQSSLVSTLEAYLDHNGNLNVTAQTLFIHLSTLKYRLTRITEIGGISFHDPQDRFHAQLALRLRRILPQDSFVQSR